MQKPDEANALLEAEKISKSIREKLSELGGVWLTHYHGNDISDLCHYYSLYWANELMKGLFITKKELRDVNFDRQAKHFVNEYDKLNAKVHAQIKEKPEVIECYNSIINHLNYLLVLKKHEELIKPKQSLLKSYADALTAEYSKLYDKEYIALLTSVEKHPESIKLHNELLPHISYKKHEYIELDSQNIITEEQVKQIIPDFNTSVLILIRDKPNYILEERDNQYCLRNIAHPDSHYISINFCTYNNKPALFMIDSNLGIIMFQNINEFKQGLHSLLSCYFTFYAQPNIVLQRFKNTNIVPREIMKSVDWQATFGNLITDNSIPTASLRLQLNMPNWAKLISNFLSKYETTQNPWDKVRVLTSLQKSLHNEKFLAEINSDAMSSIVVKDKLAQLQEQIKYFFGSPKMLATSQTLDEAKIIDDLAKRKVSQP